MKYINLLLGIASLLGMASCQTDETPFYDEHTVKMAFKMGYHPLDTYYRLTLDGDAYTTTDFPWGDYNDRTEGYAYVPLSSLRPDSTQTSVLHIYPLDNKGHDMGEPSEFTLNLKPDTAFTFVHAVNDQPRLRNDEDFYDVQITRKFVPYRYGNYAEHGITFNGEKLDLRYTNGNNGKITLYKKRDNTGTLKFYANNTHNGQYSDYVYFPETEPALGEIDNFSFSEEQTTLTYIQPLGGEVQWFTKDEDYVILNPSVTQLGSYDDQIKFMYFYRGEPLQDGIANYAVKDWTTGEAVVKSYRLENSTDTVDVKEVFRGTLAAKDFSFIWDGTKMISMEYKGEDPTDQQSVFFSVSALWDGAKQDDKCDIELWLCSRDADRQYHDVKLVKSFQNVSAGSYSDPVQIHLRGDVFPEDIYDKAMADGKFVMRDADRVYNPDYYKLNLYLKLKVYKPGTKEDLFPSLSDSQRHKDMTNVFSKSFPRTDSYRAYVFPPKFTFKLGYLQQGVYGLSSPLQFGSW